MKQPKHMRSMRLTHDINQKLEEVCEAFGTNVNAYLVSEIGKAVVRDYQTINIQSNSDKAFEAISALFAGISSENEKLKELSNG
jgi:hypothetical protein